jgi:FkbM family methyltransferase
MLMRLAKLAGVEAFLVRGEQGLLQGSARDYTVLLNYAINGVWAPRTVQLFKTLFTDQGGMYLDIGANIGATLIPVAQNAKVRCLALEPEPNNYRHLQVNVLVNCPHGNVEVRPIAAFSRRARLSFTVSPSNMGDNRIRLTNLEGEFGEERWDVVEVDALPLDEVVDHRDGLLGVKIDTQGAEAEVLIGARETLLGADLIVMEFWPYGIERMGSTVESVVEFLRNHIDFIAIDTGIGSLRAVPSAQACDELAMLARNGTSSVDVVFGAKLREVLERIPNHRDDLARVARPR